MITIIVALIGLVGGYFYVKKFAQIDTYLFGAGDSDYTPFGKNYIYVSAALGAVMGCMAAYVGMAGATSDFTYASTYMSVVILGILATVAFFTTFVKVETPAKIAGKSVFLLVSCIIAFVVGMVGAIVVLIILAIILILWIASVVLASGGSGSKKIKAKGGLFESDTELTHDYGNMYRDSSGNRWERDGDTVRKLDD